MKPATVDVLVVGAGVAGLAATALLSRAGMKVACLEAKPTIGGRIKTERDPFCALPVETGAEFVHGLPSEILEIASTAGFTVSEIPAQAVHFNNGKVQARKKVGGYGEDIISKIPDSVFSRDRSFDQHLERIRQSAEAKRWARAHVEGFNAASSKLVSAAWLKESSDAAGEDGERIFRVTAGYDQVPIALLRSIGEFHSCVHLQTVVERVRWWRGSVEVHCRSDLDGSASTFHCRALLVTVPLGVLQAASTAAGAITFQPEPERMLAAARTLCVGHVYRITFRFVDNFWSRREELKSASFFVSHELPFPTWWPAAPTREPVLTGWAAGPATDRLRGKDRHFIVKEALQCLARILNRRIPRPANYYFHDWSTDPYARGAYSYVPVDGMAARSRLAQPVEDTLFFAGEATETRGNNGTVHGAIASGVRAAKNILRVCGGV
ncbi:MAG TPA: NAD(P)/FAD-dependent oxidoreductase [Bryobacteraceae bacterium]|jgi:monoamine oxidase|nr:NAD(P)/FAD-dependent oxidoreductase [Bryobacteraceae bacterium]